MQEASELDSFYCSECGKRHDLPFAYGTTAPTTYSAIPAQEREVRCELTKDICIIDEQFYILGNLEIPIVESSKLFSWNVWVSLSKQNAHRVVELWENPERQNEPPYFGWLCTDLTCYPDTLMLKTLVHTREVGKRPFIELEPTEHPLAIEQRNGITIERVREIAHFVQQSSRGKPAD